jgi:hypothetical protein
MATLEELVIELKLDDAKLKTGLGKIQSQLKKTEGAADQMGAAFKRVGVALAGAFALSKLMGDLKQTINYMDDMADAADRVGVSSESFSKLAYAAKLTEVPLQTLEMGLRKMQLALVEAGDPGSKAAQALDAIGLSATSLRNVGADVALGQIADGLNAIPDPAQRAAIAQEIFGRGAGRLNDLLKEGSTRISEYAAEAQKFGIVVDEEGAKKAEKFKQALVRVEAAYQGMIMHLADTGAIEAATQLILNLADAVTVLAKQLNISIAQWKELFNVANSSDLQTLYNKQLADVNKSQQRVASGAKASAIEEFISRQIYGKGTAEKSLERAKEGLAKMPNPAKAKEGAQNLANLLGIGNIDKAAADLKTKIGTKVNQFFPQNTSKTKTPFVGGGLSTGGGGGSKQLVDDTDKIKKNVEDIDDKFSGFEDIFKDLSVSIKTNLGDELVNALQRGESGAKAMIDSIKYQAIRALGNIAGKLIEQGAASLVSGMGGGSSSGGIFSSLFSSQGSLSRLFQTGSSSFVGPMPIPGFAAGGTMKSGQPSIVGENGPELVVPNRTSAVIPNHKMGNSGGQFNQYVNIEATDERAIDRRVLAQVPLIAQYAADMVQGKMGNGGGMSKEVGRRL